MAASQVNPRALRGAVPPCSWNTLSHRPSTSCASACRGGVHEPGDPLYDDACTLFNAMIERRPPLVVRPLAADDVVAALAVAREHDLPIAVRAGGHSVAGHSLCDDGVVLDLRGMADVEVDPARRVARVGGGADLGAGRPRDRRPTAWRRPAAASPRTGVAGLTLGGGSGWLERKHGLACDNLVAAELVTWDGRIVRAAARRERRSCCGRCAAAAAPSAS